MDPINNTTSSPPLQPAGSPLAKPNTGAADTTAATNTGSNAAATTSTTAANTGSSTVTTLTTSSQLQAQAATASDSVFSTSKVNEIKQAISEGRFQVNSEKVADGLLDSVNNLLGARQRG